jgi:hypothetical protein
VRHIRSGVPGSLVIALLVVAAAALPAPAYAQRWLSEMPSEREVVAKIKGEDSLDSLARQHAAFDQLRFVMGKMLGRREFNPTAAQERMLSTYRSGPDGAAGQAMAASPSSDARKEWYERAFNYAADDKFRAHVMRTFFSREFRRRYASIPDPPRPPEPTPPAPLDEDPEFPKPLLWAGIFLVLCSGALLGRRRGFWHGW